MSTTRIARNRAPGLSAEQRAKIYKALSDERRIEIVDSLAKHGSQCGTQLAEELGVSIALLCHHWEVLVEAGLVKKTRVGQLRMCTLDAERLAEATGAWSVEHAPKRPPTKSAAKLPAETRGKQSNRAPRATAPARKKEPTKRGKQARVAR